MDETKETFFEHTLKRISVQAFDALLTCGVRDLPGLLQLKPEDLRQAAIPLRIITELMGVQLQLCEHKTKLDRENNEHVQGDIVGKASHVEQREAGDENEPGTLDLQTGRPIPNDLMERFPTRARNVLIREKILTCKRLLEIQEKDLFNLEGIGRKTVNDIKRLQDNIVRIYPDLRQKLVKTAHNTEQKCDNRPSFSSRFTCSTRSSEHWPSDPADWSLLSRTLPELFWVTLPSYNESNDEKQVTISDLGISSCDINRIHEIVLLPEDQTGGLG
jgi:hypothetical protein